MTVTGRVIGTDRRPVAGATINLEGSLHASEPDGSFSILNVTAPYDLSVSVTTPVKVGVVYQGLRRADPVLLLPGVTTNLYTGKVTGNVTGGDPLGATDERTWLVYGSSGDFLSISQSPGAALSNPYNTDLSWVGSISTTGTMHALQMKVDAVGFPTSFTGYGAKTGVVIADSETSNADLALSVPPQSRIAGSISGPASLSVYGTSLTVDFVDGASLALGVETASATTFDFPFPVVTGGTATVLVSAHLNSSESLVSKSGIAPGTTNLALDLRVPNTPVSPPDQSTDVGMTTEFSWNPMEGTTYVFSILGFSSSPSYYVVTSATSGRIPDFTSQGLGLPSNVLYEWHVNAFGPSSGVDDLAGPSAWDLPGDTHFAGVSAPWHFTTPLHNVLVAGPPAVRSSAQVALP
jgi:hypothetical protein